MVGNSNLHKCDFVFVEIRGLSHSLCILTPSNISLRIGVGI
jgi:hypothetical protein